MKILSSASKIVFIMVAIVACVGFVVKILPMDQFMLLASMVFGYYFTRRDDDSVKG